MKVTRSRGKGLGITTPLFLAMAITLVIQGLVMAALPMVTSAIVDTTNPTVGTVSVSAGDYNPFVRGNGSGFSIRANVSDNGGGSGINSTSCEYTLDGITWSSASYDNPHDRCEKSGITVANATSLTLNIRVKDNVGNTGTGVGINRTADSASPTSTAVIDSAIYGPSTFNSGVIKGAASDTSGIVSPVAISIYDQTANRWWDGGGGGGGWKSSPRTRNATGTTSWSYSDIIASNFINGNTYVITPRVTDAIGNTATGTSDSFIWDSVAPTATVAYTPTSHTYGSVIATITPSESVTVSNNGGSTSYTFTTNGSFTFQFRDVAGNTGSITATVNWIDVDNTAPTTTPSVYSAFYTWGTWTNGQKTIILTCEDGSGSGCATTYYCKDVTNTCTPTTVYTPARFNVNTEGISYVRYYSIDNAGNLEAVQSVQIKIDTNRPIISDDYAAKDGVLQNSNQTINLSASDVGSGLSWTKYCIGNVVDVNGVVCYPDTDPSAVACADPANCVISIIGDGERYLEYQSGDNAGNKSDLAYRLIKIDATAPTVVSVDPDGQVYNLASPNPTIKVTFSEDIVNTPIIGINPAVPIDPQTVTGCGDVDAKTFCFTYTIPVGVEVTHTIHITAAQDVAGNTMAENTSHTFTIDTIAPTATISYSPTAITNTDVVATITPSEPLAVTNNGGLFSYTFTDNGSFTFELSDMYGNPGSVVATVGNIDKTAPTIDGVVDINAEATSAAGANVTITPPMSHDATDGDVLSACDKSTGLFPIGPTTVTCSKTDTAGNAATPVTFNVIVADTTAPIVSLNDGDTITIEASTAYTEKGATWTDAVDGSGDVSDITGTVNTSTPGDYTVTYSKTDTTGNTGTATRTVKVRDTKAPIITLEGPLSMSINVGDSFNDPGYATDDGSPVIVTGSVKNTVAGIYTLNYDATDEAGNVAVRKTRTVSVVAPYETTAGQVLGETTTITGSNSRSSSTSGTEQSDSSNTPEVLGAAATATGTSDDDSTAGNTDEKSTGDTNKDTVWSWLGLAWYWWLVILVIFMGVVWWIIAARKRNRDDSQNIYRL